MKQLYPFAFLAMAAGLSACKEDTYIVDSYSTMRYDVLALPTPADTLALNTVDFVSAREGFVGGAGGSLFATTDAGATWTRRSQPTLGTINKLLFSTATSGWAGTSTGLYRTANGGQTWQAVPAGDAYGYPIGVQDVQFVTPLVGYVVGTGGGINKTTNGGTSWTSVQRRIDKRYTFRAVSFSSVDSGTVIGNDQARWLTTNGGQTWEMYDSYGSSDNYYGYDILRFNKDSYLLASPGGFMAYDAEHPYGLGADEQYGYPLYGLAISGPRGAVVGVGKRTIIRRHPAYSQSEHTPWVYVHAPDGTSYKDTYFAADFADAGTFYAVGPRGLIHRFHYQ
jgi:hypothetical protein